MSKEEKNKLVPKLRFPEFRKSEEWKSYFIIDLSLEKLTNGVFNDPNKVGSGYKLVNVLDMYIEGYIDDTLLSLLDINAIELGKNKVENGDIFFTRSSLVKAGIAHSNIYLGFADDITFDGHLIRLRPNKKITFPLFLHYVLKSNSVRSQLIARGKTATMTTIGQSDIAETKIFIPKIAEQQKIADCLSSFDELITAQNQKLDALKDHRKGLMQQLFPAEGATVPKLRFAEFKDSGEWEENTLGIVSDVRDGTHDSPKFVNEGKPLLTSKNLLQSGTLDFQNVNLISEDDYTQINKRSKVNIGDILFGMIGTIGNPVLVKHEGFAIKNVALIKEKKRLLNTYFIHFLNSDYINNQFNFFMKGNAQKFIALGVIRSIKVYIPQLTEQLKIADCLSYLDKLITSQVEKIDVLKEHKKGLMQGLFPAHAFSAGD